MKPIIVLDVDGVLNPFPFKAERSSDWAFAPTEIKKSEEENDLFLKINLSKEMGQAIQDLGCTVMWLTSWLLPENEANSFIVPRLGWKPCLSVHLPCRDRHDFYWKYKAMKLLLSRPGPKVFWVDDQILGQLHGEQEDLDPYERCFMLVPKSEVGLTREMIGQIREFMS